MAGVMGFGYVRRTPGKAAAYLVALREGTAALARVRPDDAAKLADALEAALRSEKRCVRCGRPLRDEKQPGYERGVGPECVKYGSES